MQKRRHKIVAGADGRKTVQSSVSFNNGMYGGNTIIGGMMGNAGTYYGMLEGILMEDEQILQAIYEDIYQYDVSCGTTVDLRSTLVSSGFTLTGLSDKQLEVFQTSINRLSFPSILPQMFLDMYVRGKFISTLLYNREKKEFADQMVHSAKDCTILDNPLYGGKPAIKFRPPESVISFFTDTSDHAKSVRERMNPEMVRLLSNSGAVDLDSLLTCYVPRSSVTGKARGVSMFRRVVPIYLLEKMLYRGTISESQRRQRAIMHITAGSETWTPVNGELQGLVALFQQADLDPTGAIVATRNDVNVSDVRCLSGYTDVELPCGNVQIQSLYYHDPYTIRPGTEFELVDTYVKNALGKFAKVDYLIFQGFAHTSRLTVDSGESIVCTENHQFLVLDTGNPDKHILKRAGTIELGVDQIRLDENQYSTAIGFTSTGSYEPVYDLSMNEEDGPPVFIANGMCTKNSGGDFWRWTDTIDQTSPYKLRAMGVSEAFISGESTYSGMEVSLSVFLENLRADRDYVTQETFTSHLFPLIAHVNDFVKGDSRHKELGYSADMGRRGLSKSRGRLTGNVDFDISDPTKYYTPKLNWQKSLRPEADSEYLQTLDTLIDKGVPVSLSMYASAGGLSLDELLSHKEKDVEIMKRVKDYKQAIESVGGDPDSMDDDIDGMSLSATKAALLYNMEQAKNDMRSKPKSLLTRLDSIGEETSEVYQGKKHHVPSARAASERAKQKNMAGKVIKTLATDDAAWHSARKFARAFISKTNS